MNQIGILAAREIRARVRDRTFITSTVISLLIVVAIAVGPAVLGGSTSPWTIAASGSTAEAAAQLAADAAPTKRATTVVAGTDAEVEALVKNGDADAAVLADGTLVGDDSINDELEALLRAGWRQQALVDALTQSGLAASDALSLATTPPRPTTLLDPPDENRDRRVGFVFAGVVLLFGQLLGYGFTVASGIVEEKSSRVIEVLLAKVRTRDLLVAKVIGIGSVGLSQLIIFVIVGLIAFIASGRFELPSGVWGSAAGLVVWFLLGYVLYAAMFAVVGALASRVEDLQSSSGLVTAIVTASFLGAVIAGASPEGQLASVLSYVPTTAPMVMPLRRAGGDATWSEAVLSGGSVIVAIVIVFAVADAVYAKAALKTTGRMSLLRALRST
jgi:ABC-2 type transport system permease protein